MCWAASLIGLIVRVSGCGLVRNPATSEEVYFREQTTPHSKVGRKTCGCNRSTRLQLAWQGTDVSPVLWRVDTVTRLMTVRGKSLRTLLMPCGACTRKAEGVGVGKRNAETMWGRSREVRDTSRTLRGGSMFVDGSACSKMDQ